MKILNAKYADENGKVITAKIDGKILSVPVDDRNRHYTEIKKQITAGAITVAAFIN